MGTPAQYMELKRKKKAKKNSLSLGLVIDITPDGKYASVDITGSTWKVSIPGSVLGVKVGRSVSVRTEGNIRRVEALVTHVERETYNMSDKNQRSVDTPLAGTGGGTPSYPGSSASVSNFSQYIPGFSVADASSNSKGEINKSRLYIRRLLTRLTNDTSSALSAIHRSLTSLSNAVESNRQAILSARTAVADNSRSINDMRQNVDELRDIVETMASDMRETGIVD